MIILDIMKSNIDDTIKYKFLTDDNKIIESCVVFFNNEDAKVNICVSSQVGCMFNCAFCATGGKKFIRNLTKDEIVSQVMLIKDNKPEIKDELFEITYMGTGEPLNNSEAVLKSIEFLEDEYCNIKRINLSTIMPRSGSLLRFANTKNPIRFQYSLHFIADELRTKYMGGKLMSINDSLVQLNNISKQIGEDFCLNYLLFEGINDSINDAIRLSQLVRDLNAYVKVSTYCPIADGILTPSNNYKAFVSVLQEKKIRWQPFKSKGTDIKAACGHLLADIIF